MSRNRYPGECYRCKGWVPAGDGHFERLGSSWRVQHATCAIEFRGTPDPVRLARNEPRLQARAKGTGRRAQRARKTLRDRELAAHPAERSADARQGSEANTSEDGLPKMNPIQQASK